MHILIWLTCLLGACTASQNRTLGEQRPAIAIVGANVAPMTTNSAVLPDSTVIIAGEIITAIGPRATTRIPAGATVIDARGKWLLPGLADMHVHLEHIEDPRILQLFVAKGVTTVRNMDGRPFILDWRERVASGALIGPTIITAGPILDGDPPLRPENLAVADERSAAVQARAQIAAGYDFLKVYDNLSAAAYRTLLSEAQANGLTLTGHVPRSINLGEALTSQGIEHVTSFGRWLETDDSPVRGRFHWSKLYLAQPIDRSRMAGLAQRVADEKTSVTPTMVVAERGLGSVEQQAGWLSEPEMHRLPAFVLEEWQRQTRGMAARLEPEDWAIVEQGRENRRLLLGALRKAGARIMAGTDTPSPYLVPGASLHHELAAFVDAGFTPGEAIAAATREAAVAVGQAGQWGTIVPGARADLMLVRNNPLVDLGNLRTIEGVMLRGAWLDAAARRTMTQAFASGH
ncbi:amidohydrolase family protein [Erythrobacter donghaensis]|nr:amidohydrolase family protein [Erythrobacter donghaensis]